MRFSFFFIFLCSFFYVENLFSCSCFGGKDFCSTISDENDNYIFSCQILSFQDEFITVKLLENIYNEAEDTITILGQDGLNCGASFGLNIGDSLIVNSKLILDYSSQRQYSSLNFDKVYYVDGCNTNYLTYSKKQILGNYKPCFLQYTYETFKEEIIFCLSTEIVKTKNDFNAQIFPNLIKENLDIASLYPILKVNIYNMNGSLIFTKKINQLYDVRINLNHFINGNYIVLIESFNEQISTKKVVLIN